MGQALRRAFPIVEPSFDTGNINSHTWLLEDKSEDSDDESPLADTSFPDLQSLPPELALSVLSHLNATDLCLAACVWQQLASDEILWQGLCKRDWGAVTIYKRHRPTGMSARKMYMLLDEGTLTFNSDPNKGMQYFFETGLLEDSPYEIADFFHHTSMLSKSKTRAFLEQRPDIVDRLVELQNYEDQFLPNALRKFFSKLEAPNDRGQYLQGLLESFSKRFCDCNPKLGYSKDAVYVMCFSLILLSVDLTSPHVKNKMSKREFIRNTRNAIRQWSDASTDDLCGELYDNVFLRGHVSGQEQQPKHRNFVPGYLALFL